MHPQLGKTLIELLCALSIVSLVLGMAIPSFSRIQARSEATTNINRLVGAVNYTRNAAISFNTTVTLCPLELRGTKVVCGKNWQEKLSVFSDYDRDGILDNRDKVLQTVSAISLTGSIKWRSFRNRNYLQITHAGYTNYQNGNFTYCNKNHDPTMSRQIVINVQGRARTVNNKDKSGNRLDRKGRLLRC